MKHLLIELKEEMCELLVKFGSIKPEQYEQLFSVVDGLDNASMEKMWQDVLDFKNNEYAELYRIFRLPLDNSPNGPEYWDNILKNPSYASQFPEVQLLRKQARRCREGWQLLIKEHAHGKKSKNRVDDSDQKSPKSMSV